MRYLELGFAFAAIGFVAANAALSIATALVWRVVRSWPRRARPLFLLRMLPTLGSLSVVLGLVLPAFWSFEPRDTSERAGPALVAVVVLGGVLVGSGLGRALARWLATRRIENRWKAAAVRGVESGARVPVFRVTCPSSSPLAALVGVVRPRIFLSDRFLDALSAGERRAVLDHEAGHLVARDNLKRFAMKLSPDWLAFVSSGAEIERAWSIAAEEAADDYAASGDPSRSCDLAGALLKAVRFSESRCAAASHFCDQATVAHRVERLLGDPSARGAAVTPSAARFASIAAALAVAALFLAPAARAVYASTEAAIRLLQ